MEVAKRAPEAQEDTDLQLAKKPRTGSELIQRPEGDATTPANVSEGAPVLCSPHPSLDLGE